MPSNVLSRNCRRLTRPLAIAAVSVLGVSLPVAAQTGTLTADTAVTSAHPATNYGTLSNLYVSGTSTALLRFDLGALPPAANATDVTRATLRLFVNRITTPGVITVSAVGASWNEGAVTAQTLPVTGNAVEVFAVTDEGQYVTVDVTSLVQAWLTTPAKNFGLALTASTADAVFDSKENDTTAHPAQLDVALSSGAAGPVGPVGLQGPRGDTGAAGVRGLAGPQGQQGNIGPAGIQGMKGDKGDPGTGSGMQFEGTYNRNTTYAKNNVVTYANAAWVSLQDNNYSNIPTTTSSTWSVLVPAATASGGTGTGTTPLAANGLAYAGIYSSAGNYTTNQVVTWQSAAWVSLHDTNHGNTPDQSASDWALLVPASTNPASITTVINGLLYEGAYVAATNYATNYVVTWQSAAWVSLHNSNHGNIPSESLSDWAVLVPAAIGLTGATGLQGNIGVTGPQGERGYMGTTGLQGDRGATGAMGPPGFTYQGTYASSTNYALGDVVLWQGGSWASLHDVNHGNTPDASPLDWGTLTTRGLTGDVGATGPQGAIGLQGPAGQFGTTGPQGPTGPAGSTGPQGAAGRDGMQGAQGDVGPVGTQGVAGPVGLTWHGGYASPTNYAINDAVTWQNQSWLSLHNINHGNAPDASPLDWTLLAAQGGAGPQGAPGPQGVTGLTGSAGATGSQGPAGLDGAVGSRGAPGVQGSQGPQGTAGQDGMRWQGTYTSATNYAVNDGVGWQNQSWISLHSVNHGNAPDASPLDWTLLAAQGGIGAQGAQGPQGLSGVKGDTGAQGVTGETGATGTTGSVGSPGLLYQGSYASTTNYALHDAVSYGGGTWISLGATNHGNTPGASATWWQQIAAPGAAGVAGSQGSQGVAGLQGVAGAQGATGPAGLQGPPVSFRGEWLASSTYAVGDAVFFNGSAYIATATVNGDAPGVSPAWSLLVQQGSAGAAGSQGIQGPTGLAGANGAVGPQGAAGPVGLTWRSTYYPQTGYSAGDAVAYGGASYVSLTNTNSGNTPGITAQWALLASAGAVGASGSNGASGARGDDGAAATIAIGPVHTGAAGSLASVTNVGTTSAATLSFTLPQGATGTPGTPGLTFQGTWISGTGYSKGDVVYRSGSSYASQVNTNTSDPAVSVADNTGDWKVLVAQGDPGAASVAIGTVTTGSTAAVTNSGTQNAAVLNFTLPRGAAGLTGPAGLTYQGTWSASFAYGTSDAVTYGAASYIAKTSSTGVQPAGVTGSAVAWALLAAQGSAGPVGSTGLTGPTGAAPTVAVHSTTTGAAGTSASVTNSGTSTAVQLDFVIPQGAAGTGGSTSGAGVFTTVHTVAAMNAGPQVYSPLVDSRSSGDAFVVLGYLPSACKLNAVVVYNSSSTDAKFEIHTGVPGNMVTAAGSACIAKAGVSTTCTGPGTLGSNSFVSFGITSAMPTASYLYTQFSCN